MSVTSSRTIQIEFSGDVDAEIIQSALDNAFSFGQIDTINLASGANTITGPGVSFLVTGLTIIPPAGNTSLITLKGVAGDTGVNLHKTDPTSIALDNTPFVSLVLNAAAAIVGVRLIWS